VLALNNIQLLPALKVNIIIVHQRDVVFPRENNIPRVNNYLMPFILTVCEND
jgi:hypothetical protein